MLLHLSHHLLLVLLGQARRAKDVFDRSELLFIGFDFLAEPSSYLLIECTLQVRELQYASHLLLDLPNVSIVLVFPHFDLELQVCGLKEPHLLLFAQVVLKRVELLFELLLFFEVLLAG